jgi:hypothetical protein
MKMTQEQTVAALERIIAEKRMLDFRPFLHDDEKVVVRALELLKGDWPKELNVLLYGDKDSSSIHYDEDTIPHGACSDPLHCDCMCPRCWSDKVKIIARSLPPTPTPGLETFRCPCGHTRDQHVCTIGNCQCGIEGDRS